MKRKLFLKGTFLGTFAFLFALPVYAGCCGETLETRSILWTGQETYRLDVVEKWEKLPPSEIPAHAHSPGETHINYWDLRIRCIEYCKRHVDYSEKIGDIVVTSFSLGDHSPEFVTIWAGGTCYRVRIYRVEGNRIVKVMEESTKEYPQFVYDKDGEKLIVLGNPYNHIKPGMRTVAGQFWKYRGGKYVPVK